MSSAFALFGEQIKSGAPTLAAQLAWSRLPVQFAPCATSIKERKKKKRTTLLLQVLFIRRYFLSLRDFFPPAISLFQISNLLFIFFFFFFARRALARVLLVAARCALLKCTFSKAFFKDATTRRENRSHRKLQAD